jgi:hypothetical protein
MRIQPNELVPLGHGLWVRSDDVTAVEPLREQRGPGRRTRVWVRGIEEPFVGSRSDEVIVRDITQPRELLEREKRLEAALDAVAAAIERIPPVLRRVVQQETGQDLANAAAAAREALAGLAVATPGRGRAKSQDAQVTLPEAASPPASP